MDKILHDPKDPKLWELWYIPYYGSCRILSINRRVNVVVTVGCVSILRIIWAIMVLDDYRYADLSNS